MGTAKAANPSRSVNGAIDAEVPLIQVGDDGELYFANGTDSIPFKRFPGGGKVNPGGVANQVDQVNLFEWTEDALSWIDKQEVGNMALFAVYNADEGKGGVYTIGRKYRNHPITMNLEYVLDADELGAVCDVEGTVLVSYRDGSTFGVKATDHTNKATATYDGLDLKAPIKADEGITTWSKAELYMQPLPAGCSVEFWYQRNKNGGFVRATLADGTTAFSTANGKKATFRITAEAEVFEPRVVLNPFGKTTAEVTRIRIGFA